MGEFERSLKKVLIHEGGYVNDPQDPGGETNQGVTRAVYDDYRRGIGAPTQSVRKMTDAERDAIYRNRYWSLIKGDSLPPGISYVVFDGAVNSGVGQSVKWLQRAVGMPESKVDGIVGPGTLAAVRAASDHDAVVDKICDLRLAFMKTLKGWKRFGRGWASRVAGVRATGKAWASGEESPRVSLVSDTGMKAVAADAKAAPSPAVADAVTGSGIGSGGIALALREAQDQLAPYSTGSELIGKLIAFLIIVTAVLTLGGLAWSWYARRRRAQLADALGTPTT